MLRVDSVVNGQLDFTHTQKPKKHNKFFFCSDCFASKLRWSRTNRRALRSKSLFLVKLGIYIYIDIYQYCICFLIEVVSKVMAGALVAGGVVGAAFGEGFAILHETVQHVVGQIIMFKSIFKSLESTLDGVAPVVQEIRRLSLALDHPDKETKRLIEQSTVGL